MNQTSLRRAADGGIFLQGSCDTRPNTVNKTELRMSTTALAQLERGTTCKLVAESRATSPIHLVSRPSFRIGRSARHADFLTRFFPDTPENKERTGKLSRIHVLLESSPKGITLRDGDGITPSRNGSAFQDIPLSYDRAVPLGSGGVLGLGSYYRMNVVPMPSPKLWTMIETGGSDTRDPSAPVGLGAVTFEPLHGNRAPVEAVWLFDAAGFFLDGGGEFRWQSGNRRDAPAFFLRHGGVFLLANISGANGRIEVDGNALAAGDVAPLRSGQSISLGEASFTVTVS